MAKAIGSTSKLDKVSGFMFKTQNQLFVYISILQKKYGKIISFKIALSLVKDIRENLTKARRNLMH